MEYVWAVLGFMVIGVGEAYDCREVCTVLRENALSVFVSADKLAR